MTREYGNTASSFILTLKVKGYKALGAKARIINYFVFAYANILEADQIRVLTSKPFG
jgi:hypothetical protein